MAHPTGKPHPLACQPSHYSRHPYFHPPAHPIDPWCRLGKRSTLFRRRAEDHLLNRVRKPHSGVLRPDPERSRIPMEFTREKNSVTYRIGMQLPTLAPFAILRGNIEDATT
ncbi:hypothetical protein G5I_00332 [Acromyrmex echinatior]|uniref:Uncharacterized protein n=1 Tax=Acromyrmex echinatior TaxID=103372 RepID=F4W4L1_ACREC|nr:hypothetical protein G5I_00332 [Acromyrmex echinatior]